MFSAEHAELLAVTFLMLLYLQPVLTLHPSREQYLCTWSLSAAQTTWSPFSCIPAAAPPPFHTSGRVSAARNLRLLSITTGLLSTSRLNFLPRHPLRTSLGSGGRSLSAARQETHTRRFMSTHISVKTQLLKVGSLNTHTQWVYFTWPQGFKCACVL